MTDYPVLRRVLAGALDCISEGRTVMGPGEWELEEVMDHIQMDHPEGFLADLRALADDIEAATPDIDGRSTAETTTGRDGRS